MLLTAGTIFRSLHLVANLEPVALAALTTVTCLNARSQARGTCNGALHPLGTYIDSHSHFCYCWINPYGMCIPCLNQIWLNCPDQHWASLWTISSCHFRGSMTGTFPFYGETGWLMSEMTTYSLSSTHLQLYFTQTNSSLELHPRVALATNKNQSSSLSAPVHWHCQAPVLGTCLTPRLEKCFCSQDVNNQPVNSTWHIPSCEGWLCMPKTHAFS